MFPGGTGWRYSAYLCGTATRAEFKSTSNKTPMFDPLDTLLPAPRDDEPPTLRQDIIDEVRDHLHSSLLRELHRTPDEQQAQHNVLQRFGDPAALVRKLWFQALRDKIMTQKILSASALLMAVACLIGVFLMTQLVQQNQKTTAELIQQIKDSNAQLLTQFQTFAAQRKTDQAPLSPDWVSLKLRFVLDKHDGLPAKDFHVSLNDISVASNGERQIPPMNYVVSDNGTIDFGLLKFGRYSLTVISPSRIQLPGQILTLRPQQNVEGEIVCPSTTPKDVPLTAQVLNADQKGASKALYLCEFVTSPLIVDKRSWVIPPYAGKPIPFGGMGSGSGGFGAGQGVGGGGFFNVIDRLDDQIFQSTLSSSGVVSVLRAIINEKGDIQEVFPGHTNQGVGQLGFSPVRESLPPALNFHGPVPDLHFLDWARILKSAHVPNWQAVDLKLRSITILSAPHNLLIDHEADPGTIRRISAVNVLTPALLTTTLPTDHPLRTFTARPGETNKLTIDVSKFPLDWQLELDNGLKKFAPLDQELRDYWQKKAVPANAPASPAPGAPPK